MEETDVRALGRVSDCFVLDGERAYVLHSTCCTSRAISWISHPNSPSLQRVRRVSVRPIEMDLTFQCPNFFQMFLLSQLLTKLFFDLPTTLENHSLEVQVSSLF